ncbi:MAG: F0F1 ATP synthase subunit A [Gammaproteobacteria bacterium]
MAASEVIPWPSTIAEYIGGHLQRYSVGEQTPGIVTTAWHLDTLLISWLIAVAGFGFLRYVAARAKVAQPTRSQVACEMLVDFFDRQVRDLLPNAPPIVGPLAVTIFVWVVLMNTMDLVPVDLIASTGYVLTGSVPHFKILSTADLSLTLALALSVFFLTLYYGLKVKGVGGFLHEVVMVPFGAKLFPANILLRLVEEVARPFSLSMRLYGNMLAAELIFLLIAGLSFAAPWAFMTQFIFGGPWAIYHILVVPLQAYIFAVLSVVYLAMAHEKH